MQGNVVVRVGPSAEPISLTEAKAHCRVDGTDEDSLITALIGVARAHAESATNRIMVTQSLRATFEQLGEMQLKAPLRKVTSITYLDQSAATQTLSPSTYVVEYTEIPGCVEQAYMAIWPITYDHPAAVTVDFVAGYATPFTVNATTNVLTATGHPIATGDVVRLCNTGGALPAGLSAGTNYYAIGVSGDTLQLSLTQGGAAIDITGTGTGTHFIGGTDDSAWVAMRQAMLLMIGHWFNQREQSTGFQQHEIPLGVNALLGMHKVWGV
jgi:uncharacterized phiE125 gp8 family phage protein